MRVDTQVHVVSSDRDRYPLDPPPMDVPRWFEKYPRTGEELAAEMDAAGIDRAVLVQGFSAYQYDNRYTADAARARPDRFASACIVDVLDNPLVSIRRWVDECGARAIRLFLQLGDGAWLAEPACDRVFDELTSLGVIAQAAVNADQLGLLYGAASRHPDTPVLIDHCAFTDWSGGPSFPHAKALFAMADLANVRVKLSANVFHLARESGASPRQVTESVVAVFGAERVMWASDLTVQGRPYVTLIEEAHEACAGLTDHEQALVLGDAAAALWWPEA